MNTADLELFNKFFTELISVKNNLTFETASKQYEVDILSVKAKNTQRNYKAAIKYQYEYLPANFPLRLITKQIAQKFIYSYFERGKEQQAVSLHRSLRAIFNWFIEVEYISLNPFKFKPLKVKTHLPVYLTEDQFYFLLGFIRSLLLRDFYSILYFTGLRAGELCNLQIANIDLTERILKVSNSETFSTKSKRERIIPMNQTVYEIIKNRLPQVHYLNRKHYIFYRIDSTIPLTVDYVSKQFKKAVRLSGLNPSLHLHSLRHSFCSNLVNANVSLYTVQQLAGHANAKTTAIYAHSNSDSLRNAVNQLGNFSPTNKKEVI
ncbi:MAG: tyrosine-type recombinase/integrase [Ignavibacteria bacterium]|nr:tyrosine-type recombinase/integrase [Ignavibacteria bacterium]